MGFSRPTITIRICWLGALVGATACLPALADSCPARSGATVTPVIDLYTSQGCSSCPPADRWLSTLSPRGMASGDAVIQAFHVAYWDSIGWSDPFASSAHTAASARLPPGTGAGPSTRRRWCSMRGTGANGATGAHAHRSCRSYLTLRARSSRCNNAARTCSRPL